MIPGLNRVAIFQRIAARAGRAINGSWKVAVFGLGLMGVSAFGADHTKEPQINWEPFEPPVSEFYNQGNKFEHPPEIIAPHFLWPFEMRRSIITGETVVLVQIDSTGLPERISVFSSTDKLFTRSTIFAIKKARWKAGIGGMWFYYRAVFDPGKMLNAP
jgi:hypothetical protein